MTHDAPPLHSAYANATPREIAWHALDIIHHLLVGTDPDSPDPVDGHVAANIVVAARALLREAERRERKEGHARETWFSVRDL